MKTNVPLACGCCLFAGLWIGTLAEKSVQAQKPLKDTIFARHIVLLDAKGRSRIVLTGGDSAQGPAVSLFDSAGNSRFLIDQSSSGDSLLTLMDAKSQALIALNGLSTDPDVLIDNPKSKTAATIGSGQQSGYVRVYKNIADDPAAQLP